MEGLSPSQFADKLGVQRSGVSHLLSGRNKPSFEFISKMLAAYPKLNPDWLIMGSGKAYRDMPGSEIAGQAGNDGYTTPVHSGFAQAGNDGYSVSEVPLQESVVTDNLPDLFSANTQSPAPESTVREPAASQPATVPQQPIQVPKPEVITSPVLPKLPSDSRTKQPQVIPAPGKRIAQITILYTDGTYEIR